LDERQGRGVGRKGREGNRWGGRRQERDGQAKCDVLEREERKEEERRRRGVDEERREKRGVKHHLVSLGISLKLNRAEDLTQKFQ
jgi:hypothetical protein